MSFSRSWVAASLFVVGCSLEPNGVAEQLRPTNGALGRERSEPKLVTTARLTVLRSPSPDAAVLRVLAVGTVVTSLGEVQGHYLHIEISGDDGWASGHDLKAVDDESSFSDVVPNGSDPGDESNDDSIAPGAAPGAASGAAGGSAGGSANELCVNSINEHRRGAGLAPLARWTAQETCADGEAQSDGSSNSAHGAFGSCGEIAQNECPGFPGQPEDAVPQCLRTMVDEGPGGGHYDNMFNPQYTKVACGVTIVGGRVWSVQNFR
jgi:hypothetical protein